MDSNNQQQMQQQQQQQVFFTIVQNPSQSTNNENSSSSSGGNSESYDAQNNNRNNTTILTPRITTVENFGQDNLQQQQIQSQQPVQQQIQQQLQIQQQAQQDQRDRAQQPLQQNQKPRKQKSPFTPEEDARLKELVAEKGDRAWNVIHSLMPGRSARQCRERWNLYLSPNVNNEPWTPDEVVKLYTLYAAVGPQWTLLSHQFPNRTANNIKNRLKQCLRRAQRMCRIPDKATLDAALNINNNNINNLINANNNRGTAGRKKGSVNRNPKPAAGVPT